MSLAPGTLTRHELVGLSVEVVAATDPGRVGTAGEVIEETTNTLVIGDRARRVPKAGSTFEFRLPDGEAVVVEGDRLVARPARRTETNGGTRWHSD
ncbi:MAG: ribonuclease P protein component 1 [Halobacteriales archaeon]